MTHPLGIVLRNAPREKEKPASLRDWLLVGFYSVFYIRLSWRKSPCVARVSLILKVQMVQVRFSNYALNDPSYIKRHEIILCTLLLVI